MNDSDPTPSAAARSLDIPFSELQKLLEGISDGIFITDADGVLSFANDSLAKIFGYQDSTEILGKNIYFDFIPASERHRIRQIYTKAIIDRTQVFEPLTMEVRSSSGTAKTVELRPSLHLSDGIVIGTQGTVSDVTLRQQAEDQLKEAKTYAEKANDLKDHFVATISHEIRTPMNSIQGFAALLSDPLCAPGTPEFKEYLEAVQAGSDRLMRTIDLILNISRVNGDLFDPSIEKLSVAPLLIQSMRDIQLRADEKGLRLETDIQYHDATILADRFCFLQSLTNLLDNAVKYTDTGTITVRLSRVEHDAICIDIIDTGIGIDASYLPSIFSAYSQEQGGYNRPYDGLGLGLALVKKYVQLNAGSISVESKKGEGTAFHLRYPDETPETTENRTSS